MKEIEFSQWLFELPANNRYPWKLNMLKVLMKRTKNLELKEQSAL